MLLSPGFKGLPRYQLHAILRRPPSLSPFFFFHFLECGTFPDSIGNSRKVNWRERQGKLEEDNEVWLVPSAAWTQRANRSRLMAVDVREKVKGFTGPTDQSEQEMALGRQSLRGDKSHARPWDKAERSLSTERHSPVSAHFLTLVRKDTFISNTLQMQPHYRVHLESPGHWEA